MGETPKHDEYVLLHSEMLKKSAEEIKELKAEVNGLPQRMDSMEKSIVELCKTHSELSKSISEFIQRLEDKFVTKELNDMCDEKILSEMKAIKDKTVTLQTSYDKLEKKFDWIINGLIGVSIISLGYAIKIGIDILMHGFFK
jgi:uncharacterized coiled-coil DUF342 family protein